MQVVVGETCANEGGHADVWEHRLARLPGLVILGVLPLHLAQIFFDPPLIQFAEPKGHKTVFTDSTGVSQIVIGRSKPLPGADRRQGGRIEGGVGGRAPWPLSGHNQWPETGQKKTGSRAGVN